MDNLAASAKFRRDFYPNMLEALHNYFAFGPQIISIKDLTGRLSLQKEKLTVAQIQKGFELKYIPIERPDATTPKQRMVLAEMILSNRLLPLPNANGKT